MQLSFDDSKTAFAYKSDKELKNARFLFSSMNRSWLVKLGIWAAPIALKWGLPINGLIRKTLFRQFVGGETLEQTAPVVQNLARYNVKVILDYGVEGKEGEENYEHAMEEFIRVIRYAATQPNIPFMSIKITGMARFGLLEKLDYHAQYERTIRGEISLEALNDSEKAEWKRLLFRLQKICEVAAELKVGVLVDAEETWIQDPVDALVTQMMQQFNENEALIYNTIQLYRSDRLQYLKDANAFAMEGNFIMGLKLVRGAYMEKERNRAGEKGYSSPINEDKEATDKEFNAALEYCIDPNHNIFTLVGSHNEYSNKLATDLIGKFDLSKDTARVHFSQLYGMSDNITFNLAKGGFSVSKYLPFGPIKDVVPYLMRRAEENSSLGGHTGRELSLIDAEMKRRGLK